MPVDRNYYQKITPSFAQGEGDTFPLTGDTSAAAYTLVVNASTTKGAADITTITAAANGTDPTQIDITVPESVTAAISPATTPVGGTFGPQPMTYVYCTLWRTDGTDAVLARFAFGVYDPEGKT